MSKMQTEPELIQACKNGEQEAFKELVSRYEVQIRSTVIGMLGTTNQVDEVAQDVFIRFLNQFQIFGEMLLLSPI